MTKLKKRVIQVVFAALVVLALSVASFLTFAWWTSRPVQAHYPDAYTKANRGNVQVDILEVYELANIAIAITEYGLNKPHAVRKHGQYYDRVLEHFRPYKDHPLIDSISMRLSRDEPYSRYYGFRDNSARYVFDGDRIVASRLYPKKWRSPDVFAEHLELVIDFARQSGFKQFYRENLSYYQQQIKDYQQAVPVKRMWAWLESHFPERYDSYRVIFSPLVGGSHSTTRCQGGGFREILMFVSGPWNASKDISSKVREGLLSRVVFTEIDHNYVNPIIWQHWLEVGSAFHRTGKWNRQSGYRNPAMTFNEYMTWAVFLLYARDTYTDPEFETIKSLTTDSMVNRRKFVLFQEFSGKLLELYQHRQHGQTLPDLYPEILDWAGEFQSTLDQTSGAQ